MFNSETIAQDDTTAFRDVLQWRGMNTHYVSIPKECIHFFPKTSLQFHLGVSMAEEVARKEEQR
jgi:hypothetical protein